MAYPFRVTETQIFTAIAVAIGAILLVWILWAVRMLLVFHAYEKSQAQSQALFYARNNAIPLFISLMAPFVTKGEEVFAPTIALRRRLLTDPNPADEDELSHQIWFLMTIADKHPELARDTKFARIRGEMQEREKRLTELRNLTEVHVVHWNDALRHGRWILFPGGWFLQKL